MINPATDTLISINDAVNFFPAINGVKKSINTIYRHCNRGVRGIRLESYRDGNAIYTTAAAIEAFIRALNEQPPEPSVVPISRPGKPSVARARRAAKDVVKMFADATKERRKQRNLAK